MIDLLTKEIRNLYPLRNTPFPSEDYYVIHCSQAVLDEVVKDFLNMGFIINATSEDMSKAKFTKFQSPAIGYMEMHVDMEQGYKIEIRERDTEK